MRFFTDKKFQLGTAHNEYEQYWRDNYDRMPKLTLRLSAGMLPIKFIAETNDPVFLHDARIQSSTVIDDILSLTLHGDDDGGRRIINNQYDCNGFSIPEIPAALLANKPHCDLACHEFVIESDRINHQILFASGTELTIPFRNIFAEFNPDRDITKR
ncbi:MAG: hypothetical protein CME31_14835 [Gimesia sp.]|nr:hypothetical protein [Gimesia sp.]